MKTLEERFWEKVNKTETCWLWMASTNAGDYGTVLVQGQCRLAHRVAYELIVGPIPDGLTLDHLCRVHNCVNPQHLEPVTSAENVRRHHRLTMVCKHGHAFTIENTYVNPRGQRTCRACKRRRYTPRKRPPNSSGIVGVDWMKNQRKWRARITIKQQTITLGIFADLADAAHARRVAEMSLTERDAA